MISTHHYIKSNKQLKYHYLIHVYNSLNKFVTINKIIANGMREKKSSRMTSKNHDGSPTNKSYYTLKQSELSCFGFHELQTTCCQLVCIIF
jgi:hypothetical protein